MRRANDTQLTRRMHSFFGGADQDSKRAEVASLFGHSLFENPQIRFQIDNPVASFAVLCDDQGDWRSARFGDKVSGCRASLDFSAVKSADFEFRRDEPEQGRTPFAAGPAVDLTVGAARGNANDSLC